MKKIILLPVLLLTLGLCAQQYTISKLETGTRGSDWGAVVTSKGELIFSSRDQARDANGNAVTRLYLLCPNSTSPQILFEKEGQDVPYMGSPYISPDGQTLYFAVSGKTKVRISRGWFKTPDVYYPLQIAISRRNGDGSWGTPEMFAHNEERYSSGDPWLSNDGQTLYFASDRPGGEGGIDLWRSRKAGGGSWGLPENVTELNSAADDRSPRMDGRNSFYFASNRGGLGGLDLYSCALINDGHFATPVRMGTPLNSPGDDFAITYISENRGYLSSNRTGEDEIYQFEKLSNEIATKIKVVDHQGAPIAQAQAYFMSIQVGDSQITGTDAGGQTTAHLHPEAAYTLLVYREGYLPQVYKDEKPQAYNNRTVVLEQVPVCLCPEDDALPTTEKDMPVRMMGIHFDLNRWSIRPDAAKEIDKIAVFMQEYPQAEIEVSAYTDCRGSESYNLLLSQKRANAVKHYLTGQGINGKRIKATGYGKTKLLNRCDCSRGIDCTDAEHETNRRAEYRVTK